MLRILTISVILFSFGVVRVNAHAELIASNPSPGATLNELERLELTFNETVSHAEVFLIQGSTQYPVAIETPRNGEETEIVIGALPDDLNAGTYQVVWTVSSDDEHFISGSFSFAYEPEADNTLLLVGAIGGLSVTLLLVAGIIWRLMNRHKA